MCKNPFKVGDKVYLRNRNNTEYTVTQTVENTVKVEGICYRVHIMDVSFTPFPPPAIPEPNHVRPIQRGYYLFRLKVGVIGDPPRAIFKHVLGLVDINGNHKILGLKNTDICESDIHDKKFLFENLKDYFN